MRGQKDDNCKSNNDVAGRIWCLHHVMTDNVLYRGDKPSGNETDLDLQGICPFERISTST